MRKMLTILTALMALSLVYCDDPTGVLGELGFGVIEGREQVAMAGDALLDEPVVAKVWRDRSTGQVYIGAAPLHAQETVIGVVGAVVCVGEVPIEGEPIVPHARCTATVSDGTATFHLTPPTKAGRHRTPIVAEVDGLALTPDTVTAEVEPGPASEYPFKPGWNWSATFRETFNHRIVTDAYENPIPWMFATDCACITVEGDLEDWSRQPRAIAPAAVGEGAIHVLLAPADTLATGTVGVVEVEPGVLRWTVHF